jgi:tetratricopeptide (TPR) repeat protein
MPSLIPGYEYDIFISYRQKDNKYDGWVTEFVDNLKKELEATFKEDISLYFDINPHDGLLETHDVDASLKEKLRCLIFIPIISRTYCDPNSFAWEHEFRAFVDQASKDKFGLKIKLPDGNVSSRVLPVRIHDLDPADIKECESVLGGVLRGVEFIYKEPGVDKPLAPADNEKKNLNHTTYRIQIIKVAHAIRDIISGLKLTEKDGRKVIGGINLPAENETGEKVQKAGKPGWVRRKNLLIVCVIVAGIFAIAKFASPELFRIGKEENLNTTDDRISVAVMPFQNMTNDSIWNVWQEGIQSNIISTLSCYPEDLKVRQSESVSAIFQTRGLTNYSSLTQSVASTISRKLDAEMYITGNIIQSGSLIRLNASLASSGTIDILKSFQIDGEAEKILPLIDTLSVMIKNFLLISNMKEGINTGSDYELPTDSPEAFRYYIYGRSEYYRNNYPAARNWYFKALSIDSNYFDALTAISLSFGNEFIVLQTIKSESGEYLLQQAKKYCRKVIEKKDHLSAKESVYASWIYALYFETPVEEIIYQKQLLNFDDQNPKAHYNLGICYFKLNQYDYAIQEYRKALDIYDNWGAKPNWVFDYIFLGESYRKTGRFGEARKLYRKAWKNFRGDPNLIMNMGLLLLSSKNNRIANRIVDMGITYMKNASITESGIAAILAYGFSEAGLIDKAEEYYRQAVITDPENPYRINDLAYFLIDKELNVEEGLKTVYKALELKPEYYHFLHTKGWGFYKQGKYKEALEILQKSWDIRRSIAIYDHTAFLHLEAAKKAVAENR